MRQHDPLQHRNRERINRAILQESVDPPLETAAQRELGAKHFVLPENQKQTTDSDPQTCQCKGISIRGAVWQLHGWQQLYRRSASQPEVLSANACLQQLHFDAILSHMFDGVWTLSHLAYLAVFGTCGALVGWRVEKQIRKQIRRRRLKKLGFGAGDLKSKELFFKKYGEICVAKIPQKISFQEITVHSWSELPKYEQSTAAFESLGFQRTRTFVASPQEWVAEFWLSSQSGIFAKVIDSKKQGVYSEVTVINRDGDAESFENTDECGLKHREPDRWVHCGLITPAQLVETALHRSQPNDTTPNLAECVSVYEKSVNEYLAWRRSAGISADEAKKVIERVNRKQSGLKR